MSNELSSQPIDAINGHVQDIEQDADDSAHLNNTTVRSFAWQAVSVTVRDRATKQPKAILSGADGCVSAGNLVALMGPSGSGKTTLLNALAQRAAASSSAVKGSILVNGAPCSIANFRRISSYVEQEDNLIGSVTVRETVNFAARLALPSTISSAERTRRVSSLLDSFGLRDQRDTLIGTPIRKGVSGGQKRRVGIASQLITAPKILFLDEPTSGLDSVASFEVINYLKMVAKRNNLIVIASIHQPSTATFDLFDQLLLLSGGKTCYNGPVAEVRTYFNSMGFAMPLYTNPAEYVLDLVNTDFAVNRVDAVQQLENIQTGWQSSSEASNIAAEIKSLESDAQKEPLVVEHVSRRQFLIILVTLLHRLFLKSYRDFVAYGIRIAMYVGLSIMMGTLFLRLDATQSSIQPFINAIFFGSAFMSFMAVAYVPAFLEDRATFVIERANGLYGSTAFILSNFIIGLPYLFLISMLFSAIAYWLSNFQPTASAFFTWVMWVFLDLVAAESLVVFMSSLLPNFVLSLAAVAFYNGMQMAVSGFLLPIGLLNVFWKYVFYYFDYQAYVFQGMMVNEFAERSYDCGASCQCMYQTELASQCRIAGTGVLAIYDYSTGKTGQWVGILLAIILGFRLCGWAVLKFLK
ncbi:MAG: hypothetical protein M1829_001181 [Trizodia sp. TS-e1964]|nr:MAG: hypothetical protein M1829_001181 [Trizodia sp. TS-e1964]